MKLSIRLAVLSIALAGTSCRTYSEGDLTRYATQHDFPITTGAPPPNSARTSIVSMQEDGFYLFGYVPIVPVSLQGCLDRMMKEGKRRGAHGIAEVSWHVNPAYLFKFSSIGLPDWAAKVVVTGTAYVDLPPDPSRRPRTDPTGTVRTTPAPTPGKK